MRRNYRFNHFRHRMNRNKAIKVNRKADKKAAKKANKYKAKKSYIVKRVTTHRKKAIKKQAAKNDHRAAKKALKKVMAQAKLPVVPTPVARKPVVKTTVKVKVPKKAPAKVVAKPKVTTTKAPTPKREIESKKKDHTKELDRVINKENEKSAKHAEREMSKIPTA